MNLLLLSINNTRTRLVKVVDAFPEQAHGAWEETTLWHGPTQDFRADALAANRAGIDGLVISSVVPSVEASLQEMLQHFRHVRVSPEMKLNFSLEDYAGRATLGADRIADMAAVAEDHPLPAIILDLGTAVTVDVLDADRRYLGGMIAPGLRLFTEYLGERTAQLPRLELGDLVSIPPRALGQDTREAITAGALHGFVGQCQGLLETAIRALPTGTVQSIIVTGGDAAIFHSFLAVPGVESRHVPELGLAGMRLLGRLNIPTS